MKHLIKTGAMLFTLFLLLSPAYSQQTAALNGESIRHSPPDESGTVSSEQIILLQQRKALLEKRLATLSPSSDEYALTANWIRELDEKIAELKQKGTIRSSAAASSNESNVITVSNVAATSLLPSTTSSAAQAKTEPDFRLSRPVAGATNEVTELLLAWTEDHPCATFPAPCPAIVKNYRITKFIVEIAIDKNLNANNQFASDDKRFPENRFAKPVFVKEVASDGERAESIKVPKETLQSGQQYHWQVWAEYVPQAGGPPLYKRASNAPTSFKTAAQAFAGFESKGFTLQRAVSGDDATEGAEFGFLRTFNKNTVYTADFALIYDSPQKSTQETSVAFRASVQGSLSSDESESEDALQFRAGAIIDRNLKRNTINGLYISLAAKYETDRKFKIGKFMSENMLTPTFPALGIGIPFGRSSDPIQFRWRPFIYFDVGRTFRKGDSEETEDTILRLTPRVRAVLTLNFLRRALNLNDTFVYVDNYFYYSPLEKTKQQHNMFTSGFSLQMTKNFGFGLTYKKGEAAPKFKPVGTFGGVLTIRFGKDE